jgi:hypothetical protein
MDRGDVPPAGEGRSPGEELGPRQEVTPGRPVPLRWRLCVRVGVDWQDWRTLLFHERSTEQPSPGELERV